MAGINVSCSTNYVMPGSAQSQMTKMCCNNA